MISDNELDEVVLTGYGVIRKSDVTGSMSSLDSDDFNEGIVSNIDQLIQGRVSGVQISQNDGEPGSGLSVNIRGSSSISASNQPLYVVDGLIIDNSSSMGVSGLAVNNRNEAFKNPLNTLNPNDIESISVLKDAASGAIYGSRAANGVIVVKTKRGARNQDAVFAYEATFGTSEALKLPDVNFCLLYTSDAADE